MPATKTNKSAKKRIYNPITRQYYQVRTKNTAAGNKGSIIGLWKPKKSKAK